MSRTLIVYYSRTGTARLVAELMAAQSGWQLTEVTDARPRAGFLGDVRCVIETLLGKRAPYRYEGPDLGSFDQIVVLAPIWMGHLAAPMRDFLKDQTPLPGHLSVVCVMAARGAFRAVEEIAQITAMIPSPVLALCQRDVLTGLSHEEVAGFVEQVRVAGQWGQVKRRPVWLSPSEA